MISSYLYAKEYGKLKNKMAIIYPVILFICLIMALLTGLFVTDHTLRVILFVVFIVIAYMLRDPYVLYIQDTIFRYVDSENRRAVVSKNSLFYKIGNIITCILSIMTLTLFDQKQYITFGFYGILVFISLIFSILLCNQISKMSAKTESNTNWQLQNKNHSYIGNLPL